MNNKMLINVLDSTEYDIVLQNEYDPKKDYYEAIIHTCSAGFFCGGIGAVLGSISGAGFPYMMTGIITGTTLCAAYFFQQSLQNYYRKKRHA